jgi:phosphohistidine phosphatase
VASSRQLVVMRHAAAASDGDGGDHGRPLTPDGRREAADVGARLARLGAHFDAVLCSSALRARQTWESLPPGLSGPSEPDFRRSVYHAGAEELLDLLRESGGQGEDVQGLLVIGHNPTVQQLLADLLDDPPARFRPGAAAVLAVDGPWSGLGHADLVDLLDPRQT